MSFVYPGGFWPVDYWQPSFWPTLLAEEPEPEPAPTVAPAAFVNGTYSQILVADRAGRILGELRGRVENMTWELNNYGQARIDVKATTSPVLMEYGNRVLIYVDNGLPPWSGFIDPPRQWDYGMVSLSAFGGEKLLTHRLSPQDAVYEHMPPGAVVDELIRGHKGERLIDLGRVSLSGDTYSGAHSYEEILSIIQQLPVDFYVTAHEESGRLRFYINVVTRRGNDLRWAWLIAGHNAASTEANEQGPIQNDIIGVGGGTDTASRVYAMARSAGSVARYGLREGVVNAPEIYDANELESLAGDVLAQTEEAYNSISLNAINLPPARFSDYHIGDRVGVELTEGAMLGWRGMKRVIGRDFSLASGYCKVVLV